MIGSSQLAACSEKRQKGKRGVETMGAVTQDGKSIGLSAREMSFSVRVYVFETEWDDLGHPFLQLLCLSDLRPIRQRSTELQRQTRKKDQTERSHSPFGNRRIKAFSQLPDAYRSVTRPSSPLFAKASTICSYNT